MNDLTKIIPVCFFLIAFFYLFINGLLLKKNKIGKIGKIKFKARFCSLTNLKTGNSSSNLSKIIITENNIYFLTNFLFYTIGDKIGLLKKIPLKQIKNASMTNLYNKNKERIYIELLNGDNFILKCSNQSKLLYYLNIARGIEEIEN